jgi:hypothetical protein
MIPAKADAEAQQAVPDEARRPRRWQARRGRRTVLFVEAAHFVYGPFLGGVGCLARPFVPAPAGRKRYHVLAALDAVAHRLLRVSTHCRIDAAAGCPWLRQVAAAGRPRPMTLVLDNAR